MAQWASLGTDAKKKPVSKTVKNPREELENPYVLIETYSKPRLKPRWIKGKTYCH